MITCPTVKPKLYTKPKNIISSSLITNKHIGTFGKINYGLICSIDETNLLSISSEDSNTLITNRDRPINGYFYTNSIKDFDLYSKFYVNSLKTPNMVESEMLLNTLKKSNTLSVQAQTSVYSDITLNAQTTKFLGVLLIYPCTQNDIEAAQTLAQNFKLNIITINRFDYNKNNKEQHKYDITNIDTILDVYDKMDYIKNQFSNLMYSSIGEKVCFKDQDTGNYLLIYKESSIIEIVIKGINSRFIVELYPKITYKIDDNTVSKEEFQCSIKDHHFGGRKIL